VLFVLSITGCATLNRDECRQADWFSIGYEDGVNGLRASQIGQHRKACAKHGIIPDFNLYEQGWQKGVVLFCTPRNGYELGKKGRQYNEVCPGSLRSLFLDAYHDGRALYNLKSDIRNTNRKIETLDRERKDLVHLIREKEDELVRDDIEKEKRKQLLKDFRALEIDLYDLDGEYRLREKELHEMEKDLYRMEAESRFE